MSTQDCIFCRILEGDLPCERIDEAPEYLAILDIQPVSFGHTLVIARPHIEFLHQADEPLLSSLIRGVRAIAPRVISAMNADGYNLHVNTHRAAGQVVPHLHFHIIPRKVGDGIRFGWRQGKYVDGEMNRVAEQIRSTFRTS